jgi:hypothetical protein
MSDVQFEEDTYSTTSTTRQEPVLVRWVLKAGLVETPQQASYLLLALAGLFLILTIFISVHTFTGTRFEGNPEEARQEAIDNGIILPY